MILISSLKQCKYHLRFYQTRIMWFRSLSAILPLFWRQDLANFLNFAAKTIMTSWDTRRFHEKLLLWRYEIHDVFPRNWANAPQNLRFFRYFTIKFNIFSLNLTGDSDFLIPLTSTLNKLSITSFSKIWMIRCFAVVNYIVRKCSFCSIFYVDVLEKIYLLHIFTDSKTVVISWNMILQLKYFI